MNINKKLNAPKIINLLLSIHTKKYKPINGRTFCKKHNVKENKFAKTICDNTNLFDWGISPMYPWRI